MLNMNLPTHFKKTIFPYPQNYVYFCREFIGKLLYWKDFGSPMEETYHPCPLGLPT